jgi:hypothetical protein
MDRYGRLLGYINRHQLDPETPTPWPLTYNERLLEASMVSPYFIWPNVNPFRASESVIATAEELAPGHARDVADGEPTLRRARQWVGNARQRRIGLDDQELPTGEHIGANLEGNASSSPSKVPSRLSPCIQSKPQRRRYTVIGATASLRLPRTDQGIRAISQSA